MAVTLLKYWKDIGLMVTLFWSIMVKESFMVSLISGQDASWTSGGDSDSEHARESTFLVMPFLV